MNEEQTKNEVISTSEEISLNNEIKAIKEQHEQQFKQMLNELTEEYNKAKASIVELEQVKQNYNSKLYDILTSEWKALNVKKDIKEVIKDPSNLDYSNIKKTLLKIIDNEGLSYTPPAQEKNKSYDNEDYNSQFKIVDGIVTK